MDTGSAPAPASPQVPRGALLAIAALVATALFGAGAVRLSGIEIREPDAPALVVRELRFVDLPDGGVGVDDVRQGVRIATFEGENGFLRSTLRGLARERRRSGIGEEPPFELVGRADGRLTLIDPTTRRIIDLESFGPTNAAVFARLLPQPPQRP
jgi:putative photosynthetic complex assembly protein